jgi:hypothetical protein
MEIGTRRIVAVLILLMLAPAIPKAQAQPPPAEDMKDAKVGPETPPTPLPTEESKEAGNQAQGGDDLAVGDEVILDHVFKPRNKSKPVVRATWVCASATLQPYKEIDAFFGPMPKPYPSAKGVRLPSGAMGVAVPVKTPALVLEEKEPDGVLNDSPAVRVLITGGSLAGEELWIRRTRVFPRKMDAQAAKPKSVAFLHLAQKLEARGKAKPALVLYRHIVERYSETASARTAHDRVSALSKERDTDAESQAPKTEGHVSK